MLVIKNTWEKYVVYSEKTSTKGHNVTINTDKSLKSEEWFIWELSQKSLSGSEWWIAWVFTNLRIKYNNHIYLTGHVLFVSL